MPENSRIVLFPYGQPVELSQRLVCEACLLCCGADTQRFLDGPWKNEDHLFRYVSRLSEAVQNSAPLVVLTRSNPLPIVVLAKRRRLCRVMPFLRKALWIIFVDAVAEPYFFRDAVDLGRFDLSVDEGSGQKNALVWMPDEERRGFRHERYLVLMPQTELDSSFSERLALLWEELNKAEDGFEEEEASAPAGQFSAPPPIRRKT